MLIEAAWAGLAVEDSNLTVQIAALRRALGQVPSRAIRVLERCLDLSRTWEFGIRAPVAAALGIAHALAGRADEALPVVASTVEEFRGRQTDRPSLVIPEVGAAMEATISVLSRLGGSVRDVSLFLVRGDDLSLSGAD